MPERQSPSPSEEAARAEGAPLAPVGDDAVGRAAARTLRRRPPPRTSPAQRLAGGGRLAGKVALVTGGASGIGRAVVEGLVGEGARAVVIDLSESGLGTLRAELGETVRTVRGDVREVATHERGVATCLEAFGRLDVLVPNAGVFDGFLRLEDLSLEALETGFREIFDVNVKGYLLAVKVALEPLRRARGCVICTASTASFHPAGGGPLYTASKHAVLGLVRQLAHELAPEVRVNAVAPGGTMTELATAPSLRGLDDRRGSPEERRARIEQRNPLRLAQRPCDHVGAYVLLASDESRAMTGTVIASDGGIGVKG
ncbi:MAG TPA: SDR family NAD(P)-dependent oxidoreductase [Candidatus Dormibacteraeota bacterium]|nr:SDR family NAD(P)-dependent oxidoreductase [Candidatus Dormibacteraeota bacterium]